MKRILIITYYWPPSGGAAVQRWLSFANLLAERNKVYVLTVDKAHATYQLLDESLVNDVHPSIQVHSTKTSEPFKIFTFFFGKKSIPAPAFSNEANPSFIKKITRFIRGNLFIPDPRKGWKRYALKKARQLLQGEKIDCVITAGPPHSTHFIGETLKKETGIFWIADFHDLWTDVIYYDMLYHLPIVKKLDQSLERRILEGADIVVTVGEKYKAKLLSKSSNLRAEKIEILRIGYDETLFENKGKRVEQHQFVITYTGTIADFYQPEVFITALKKVVETFPDVSFRLRFAGILSDSIKTSLISSGLENILEDIGYVSHKQAVKLMQDSTVLLLVNPVTKDEEMVIPGKIYEYLAAGKPIINIAKSGSETASIISDCHAGRTFNRIEDKELALYLTQLVLQWKEKKNLDVEGNKNLVKPYSRREMTKHLEKVIEQGAKPIYANEAK